MDIVLILLICNLLMRSSSTTRVYTVTYEPTFVKNRLKVPNKESKRPLGPMDVVALCFVILGGLIGLVLWETDVSLRLQGMYWIGLLVLIEIYILVRLGLIIRKRHRRTYIRGF